MFNLIQELDKPKLRNNFVVNKVEIQLTLTDNYIILSENAALRAPTHFCRLGFDVKFELIYTSKFVYLIIFRMTKQSDPQLPLNWRDRIALSS